MTAVHIAQKLRQASTTDSVVGVDIAEALLADESRLFPQKRAFVLCWVVDVLIRSHKQRRSSTGSTGSTVQTLQTLHRYWHLLARLISQLPGGPSLVHSDLIFALGSAVSACSLQSFAADQRGQVLQNLEAVLLSLEVCHGFQPRIDGLSVLVKELCCLTAQLANRKPLNSASTERPLLLQSALGMAAASLRILCTALQLASNQKRSFSVVVAMMREIILLNAAARDCDAGGQWPTRDVHYALRTLMSSAMFHKDQLSDYHLAFSNKTREPGPQAKGGRALASYQTELFATVRGLLAQDHLATQIATLRAIPWFFDCFAQSMQLDLAKDNRPEANRDRKQNHGDRQGNQSTARLSAKVGFEFFVECHGIVEFLLRCESNLLRSVALGTCRSLLGTLLATGIYRQTMEQHAEQSRTLIHAPMHRIATAVLDSCTGSLQKDSATALNDHVIWDAHRELINCADSLLQLGHDSIERDLQSWWQVIEMARAGTGSEHSLLRRSMQSFREVCYSFVRRLFATYQRLSCTPTLVTSLIRAVQQGHFSRQTVAQFDLCKLFAELVPSLPPGQIPQLCAAIRGDMQKLCASGEQDKEGLDIISAMLVTLLQHTEVDESTSPHIEEELHRLDVDVIRPQLQLLQQNCSNIEHVQALLHVQRASIGLGCRLRYSKALLDPDVAAAMVNLDLIPWDKYRECGAGAASDENKGQVDLAVTYAALQQLAVLHDSVHVQLTKQRTSAEIERCVSYIWKELDDCKELFRSSAARTTPTTARAHKLAIKWQWITQNFFLLCLYTDRSTLEKFLAALLRCIAGHQLSPPGATCQACSSTLIQDHRLFELSVFRAQLFSAVASLIAELLSTLSGNADVQSSHQLLSKVASEQWSARDDGKLIKQWTRESDKECNAAPDADGAQNIQVQLSSVASLLRFLCSVPSDFMPLLSVMNCIRMALAMQLICATLGIYPCDTSTESAESTCLPTEIRRFLSWALQIATTGKRLMCVAPDSAPVLVAAFQSLLTVASDHTRTASRTVIFECLQAIAADQASAQASSPMFDSVLQSTFNYTRDGSRAASLWKMSYLTAFLHAAVKEIEASGRFVDTFSSSRGMSENATTFIPACVSACMAALEDSAQRLQSCPKVTSSHESSVDCTTMKAMAALLNARRIITLAGHSPAQFQSFDKVLHDPVTTCAGFLVQQSANATVGCDISVAALELLEAIARLQFMVEPPMSSVMFGTFIAIIFRSHAFADSRHVRHAALKAFQGIACGSSTEQMALMLETIASELTMAGNGLPFLRVWTAMEALRSVDEALQTQPKHCGVQMRQFSGTIVGALLDVMTTVQHKHHRVFPTGKSSELTELEFSLELLTRMTGLLRYPPAEGVHEAQTACLLQEVQRALGHCDVAQRPECLRCMEVAVDLLSQLVKLRPKHLLHGMPLLISCAGKVLNLLWDLGSAPLHPNGCADETMSDAWDLCAAKLCGTYELLAKSLAAPALRRYVSYIIADYVQAALRRGA
jgi:hypothetical protein